MGRQNIFLNVEVYHVQLLFERITWEHISEKNKTLKEEKQMGHKNPCVEIWVLKYK